MEFIFSSSGKQYRFVRSLRYGSKGVNDYHNCMVLEDGSYVPFFENPKLRSVTQKAQDLIGLSTVVQAQDSGIRLEAMFIDEGFGSLDHDSINDAPEVLRGVQRSHGLVGVISHVDRLEEMIQSKIEVVKGRHGSRCAVT